VKKGPPKTARIQVLDKARKLQEARLRQVLLKSRDKMELAILKHARKGNFMAAASVRDGLYREIRDYYIALQGDVDKWARSSITSNAREWRRLGIDDLPHGQYNQTFSQFDRKYLRNMVGEFAENNPSRMSAVNSALGGMLQNDIRVLRATYADVARLGAATGMTTAQQQRELIAKITDARPAWQFVDKSGRSWSARNYFRMLVNTTTANVARDTYEDVLTEAGEDLASVEGGITHGICEQCLPWIGKVLSITGKTRGFPTVDDAVERGLFHPNCRHYLAVVFVEEITERQKRAVKLQLRVTEHRKKQRAERESRKKAA